MLSYGDGSMTTGELYNDTVTISGLTASSQTLGAAHTYSEYVVIHPFANSGLLMNICFRSFQEGPSDGLIGLAYPQLSSYNATPFFNTLISAGTVQQGLFGFKLATNGSELFLGGADPSLYTGEIQWNDVTTEVCAILQSGLDCLAV